MKISTEPLSHIVRSFLNQRFLQTSFQKEHYSFFRNTSPHILFFQIPDIIFHYHDMAINKHQAILPWRSLDIDPKTKKINILQGFCICKVKGGKVYKFELHLCSNIIKS